MITRQENVQRQSLNMAQATIQACNILSMSMDEVYEFIKEASMENPLISFESMPYLAPTAYGTAVFAAREASIDFAEDISDSLGIFNHGSRLKAFLRLQIPPHLDTRLGRIVRYLL